MPHKESNWEEIASALRGEVMSRDGVYFDAGWLALWNAYMGVGPGGTGSVVLCGIPGGRFVGARSVKWLGCNEGHEPAGPPVIVAVESDPVVAALSKTRFVPSPTTIHCDYPPGGILVVEGDEWSFELRLTLSADRKVARLYDALCDLPRRIAIASGHPSLAEWIPDDELEEDELEEDDLEEEDL